MKSLSLTSCAIILGTFTFFSSVYADCASDPIVSPTALVGTTVCVVNESQEFHQGSGSSGDLIDYKKGSSDPVDPTTSVGSWSISGNNITYTYGGTSFTYTLRQATGAAAPTSYCNISTSTEFFIDQIISGSTASQCNWAVAPAS